ncbi:cbb3-type cytochrome c oxidase subunit 3 [Ferrimonas sp. YFM]|uniref:cbb3-type cytochrome oxidase subunit 3 n=1 Tax=Ferrimonas sp. YFM TaxID=3028878 RepID=UPI0025745F4C|nr:cbb3-type cytochrome c oxidase subunit 3 [Ferrimonas sp. YFM]BDY04995.1 cytochrome oxidase [Ferrimonas sp. YFM]
MDYGTFQGIVTLVLLLIFLAIVGWAYSARQKPAFEEAANLVFDDEQKHQGSKE